VHLTNNIIVKDPEILGGAPVFRGTRVPYQALLDYLEGGETLEEFLDDFPTVTREAAVAALELGKARESGEDALPHLHLLEQGLPENSRRSNP
jgi:uncharacterized protein (DUF433 family)